MMDFIAILTSEKFISEDLGIMLENIKLKILKGQRLLPLIRNIQKM
jgi:hypothetical protein